MSNSCHTSVLKIAEGLGCTESFLDYLQWHMPKDMGEKSLNDVIYLLSAISDAYVSGVSSGLDLVHMGQKKD